MSHCPKCITETYIDARDWFNELGSEELDCPNCNTRLEAVFEAQSVKGSWYFMPVSEVARVG